jgi:holo-[acyl-carrier protein] synthase
VATGFLGIGIDLVDVARVQAMLDRFGDRALYRLLTDEEQAYVKSMARPALHVAARVAAKEAVFKALQSLPDAETVTWQHLEVTRGIDGRPAMLLHGPAAELADRHGPLTIHLSLTHSELTAGAVAVLLRD